MVFTGTLDDLDFPVKFSCKNWQIFFKNFKIVWKVFNFFRKILWIKKKKICWFVQKNLTVFIRKHDDFCRKIWLFLQEQIWWYRFFYKKMLNFHVKIRRFFFLIVKSQGKFSTFSGKFYELFKNICRFIQKNLTVFIGNCNDSCKKNLMLFTGTFDDLDFPVKTAKFSSKNWQIFFKICKIVGKVFSLVRKILWIFKENLSIYTEKFNSFYMKMWWFL